MSENEKEPEYSTPIHRLVGIEMTNENVGCLPMLLVIIILLTSAIWCSAQLHYPTHIYHTERLLLIQSNLTVSGTVEHIINEKDGDIHIRLKLDSNLNLLNDKNYSAQHGCLVLEIICACKVTQPDAITACKNYKNTIPIPSVGQHIIVTGDYVLDKQHGWNEIHPITSLRFN